MPPVGPDEVMVAVAAVGVCGSDMHYYDAGRNGQNILREPTVLGHEASGVVIAAGATSGVQTGTRVAVEPAVACCGVCPTCRSGRYNICPYGTCLGSPPTNGAMSDYVVVAARAVDCLPDSIDTITGAMIEPLAVAVWAAQRAQVRLGQRVLITGAGPIGILAAQVARASGASEIVMTDVNDDRLAKATTFGRAAPNFLALSTGSPVAIVVVMVLGFMLAAQGATGVQMSYFPEMFGNRYRYAGVTLGREFSSIIGGGVAPLICAALLAAFAQSWVPVAIYMTITMIVSFLVTRTVPETVNRDLNTPDDAQWGDARPVRRDV